MPVLPLVGSIRTVLPGVILPAFSAASISARPMRSLTLETGILALQLDQNSSWQTGGQFIQPDQRGPSNDFRYIRGYTRHNDLLFLGYDPA